MNVKFKALFKNKQRNFYYILALSLIAILFTYPFLRYPYDMFHHLIQIDKYYEATEIPKGRELWHFLWAKFFYFFSIPNSDVFFRARIIHLLQTYIAFFSVFFFSKVVIRNVFKQIDKTILNYLSLWSVIIWFSIFATFSVHYQQVWNLWYSVNYQITLPLFWYITALTLILFLEETSIKKKIFFIIQILVISRFILQVHSMEFLYYLMYLFIFAIVYLDKVYYFLRKYYYVAIPMAISIVYIIKNYQPEQSKFFTYLSQDKISFLYQHIMSQGQLLINSGYNRANASINELMVVIFYLGIIVVLIVVRNRLYHVAKFIDFRKFIFILITSLFVIIPVYEFTGGLFAIITRLNVVHRMYYSASLYVLLPIFIYYLWSLKDHKNISILKINLTLIILLSSVWLYSKYVTPDQTYYKNVKSIKNSFFERRVGFNLSKQQIELIGEKLEAYEKGKKTNKEIYYYARSDVVFVIKYIYHKDVYFPGRRANPTYKGFKKYINKMLVDKSKLKTVSDYLELHKDSTIILSVRNEGSRRLSLKTKACFISLGIDIEKLNYKGSFIAIISHGKLIDYEINNEKKILLSSKKLKMLGIDHVSSAGLEIGNISEIIIKGKDHSKKHRGINLVVIHDSGDISSTYADTFLIDHVGKNIPHSRTKDLKEIVLFEIPSAFPDYQPYQ